MLELTLAIGFAFGFTVGLFVGVGLAKYLEGLM